MNKIKFNIISHHRAGKVKTIKAILDCGFDKNVISIYLNDVSTYDEYKEVYPDINIVAIEGNNAASNRNHAMKDCTEDSWIVVCDDDLLKFTYTDFDTETNKLVSRQMTIEDFEDIFNSIRNNSIRNFRVGNRLWDRDLYINKKYKDTSRSDAAGCCLCVKGIVPKFDETWNAMEDGELCFRMLSQDKDSWTTDIRYRLNMLPMFKSDSGGINYGKYHPQDFWFKVIDKYKDVLVKPTPPKVDAEAEKHLERIDLEVDETLLVESPKRIKAGDKSLIMHYGKDIPYWYVCKQTYGIITPIETKKKSLW